MTKPIRQVIIPSLRDWRDGIYASGENSWYTSSIALPPSDLECGSLLSLSLDLILANIFSQEVFFPLKSGVIVQAIES